MKERSANRLRVIVAAAIAIACSDTTGTPPPSSNSLSPRTFRMGFTALSPKPTSESVVATLNAWSPRADAAIMHLGVPYNALLHDTTATSYVTTMDLALANYYRSKNFQLFVTIDVTDGLNRAAEAPDLVALHRSITEPAIQQLYRQYAQALVSVLRPDYLGLAAETNLIRDQAPATVYAAMVQMTNAAAADVRAMPGALPQLYVSLQADEAWGPPPGAYRGVETDFRDFPFMQAMGISSYPYFFFTDPAQIPLDYYTRLTNGRSLPVMVVEGGWASASAGSFQSSPALQARYLRRHERMLDSAKAIAVFQLLYADFDLAANQIPAGSILPLFASIGLADAALGPKPALATYDSIFARPLRK